MTEKQTDGRTDRIAIAIAEFIDTRRALKVIAVAHHVTLFI